MLNKLQEFINSQGFRGELENGEISKWNSLDINYYPPRVERLWKQWGDYRVYMHLIHVTDKPCLFHKHRWPSAIYQVKGSYEMGIAYSEDKVDSEAAYKLPLAARIILSEGSAYEMTESHALHYVRPIQKMTDFDNPRDYSLSIMISGKIYLEAGEEAKEARYGKLFPVPDYKMLRIMELIKFSLPPFVRLF